MFKIKLSILLLTSFFIFSCANNQNNQFNQKYSLAYIGGDYDGLLLKNYLMGNLKNFNIYDPNSNLEIKATITHTTSSYITNINNTSDRERINTRLSFQIINTVTNCEVLNDEISVSQFYIYTSSDKFLSNLTAAKEIKKNNTEATVRHLLNKLKGISTECNE